MEICSLTFWICVSFVLVRSLFRIGSGGGGDGDGDDKTSWKCLKLDVVLWRKQGLDLHEISLLFL